MPYADPDLSAIVGVDPDYSGLTTLLRQPLPPAIADARKDIVWPVEGVPDPATERALRKGFSGDTLTAAITSAGSLLHDQVFTGGAARKSNGGLPLLAYDDTLSATFTDTADASQGAATVQQFLADTLALLQERPSVDRAVLVAAPRGFDADPQSLAALFRAVAEAPWITPTTTGALLGRAVDAAPEPTLARNKPATPGRSDSAAPAQVNASPLDPASLGGLHYQQFLIRGLGQILTGSPPFATVWSSAASELLSSRWRGHLEDWKTLSGQVQAATEGILTGVKVVPSTVNFFADDGSLQITVVNSLSRPVHDVRLQLTPGNPKLQIDTQPKPLEIGARSRANVRLHVRALAAGRVPILAQLSTPSGVPLGDNAKLTVHVQPPGAWIFWVFGVIAGLILVLGIIRTVRRGGSRLVEPREDAPHE